MNEKHINAGSNIDMSRRIGVSSTDKN